MRISGARSLAVAAALAATFGVLAPSASAAPKHVPVAATLHLQPISSRQAHPASGKIEVPFLGAPPAVYGEILTPGAARTIVFYAHYDGQPLDPKEWATAPWEPVQKGH